MLTQKNENEPMTIYKNNKAYQEIVREKYQINNLNNLYDDRILLLIFAYEWFNCNNNFDKVCYHPYLTHKDYNTLDKIYQNQKLHLSGFLIPFFGILYYLKNKYAGSRNYRNNVKPNILIFSAAVIVPICSWYFYFNPKMNRDIYEHADLKKYFALDIDKNKIKEDLMNYNIKV